MIKQKKLSILALLGVATLLAGCTDEEMVKPIVPGENVQFGAAASFETGNDNRDSRTIYGEVVGNKIQLNWVPGEDIIDIAYPEAAQSKLVAYKVSEQTISDDKLQSVANTLEPQASPGLQWGAPSDGVHHFYAVYPSQNMLGENDGTITMDADGLTGYMPNAQDPKEMEGNDRDGFVMKPDMRYAYMVAQTAHQQAEGNNVTLDFHPLVTALEFTIVAKDVNENVADGTGITLQNIMLQSTDGSNICGHFNYKFQGNGDYTVTDTNPSTGQFDRISMNIPNGARMERDTKLNFTFFIVPTKDFDASKLQLTFTYIGSQGSLTYKTATINKGIQMRKKYFFNNISFPAISAELSPSKWFSLLDDNIYLNQLSIPVAGNAFSNDYSAANVAFHKEQVTDYVTLWNQGVRGFELVTDWGDKTLDDKATINTDFGNTDFVCGEEHLRTTTFDTAVKKLMGFLANNETKNEFLFLICHYHPADAPMNPQGYLNSLCDYFDKLMGQAVTTSDGSGTHTITADDFVLYDPNLTVGDIRSKVCIIIRPGDDDYMKWRVGKTTEALTLSGTLADKMLFIRNWGSAYDRWDKRYVGAVREATWADEIGGVGTRIEEYLYGCTGTNAANYGFKEWTPVKRTIDDTMFEEKTNKGNIYIQEWMRVVPQSLHNKEIQFHSDSYNLWPSWNTQLLVRWPESISDKKEQIDYLFGKSTSSAGNAICFNVLSGYYITDKLTTNTSNQTNYPSITPFKYKFAYPAGKIGNTVNTRTFQPANQGNGGNFAGLAADLNTYVYNKLTTEAYGRGPLGLVQIDFIGATEANFDEYDTDAYNTDHAAAAVASQNIVSWIAMNNFRFEMQTKPGVTVSEKPADPDLEIK